MNNDENQIVILETSDIHGHIYPHYYSTQSYADVGLSKLATIIKKEREKSNNLFLIDNGDIIQGTPLTYHYVKYLSHLKNPMITILNELQYDAAVIGNHEFNYGLEILDSAVKESAFPWLSANIVNKDTNKPYFGLPYIVKIFPCGVRMAVLGVTTHYIPNWENPLHIKGLKFEDALETTKCWAEFIQEKEKPDIFVVSYHGGFEKDIDTGEETEPQTGENQAYEICQQINGIDILLTGHQHRSIQAKEINGVTIVQPSYNGQVIGKITITVYNENGQWAIKDKASELLFAKQEEADETILKQMIDYENETQRWLDRPIGKITGDMTVKNVLEIRLKDHALIEFINKVQMDIAGVDISNTALFSNQSPGFKEHVTMREIVSNYIYPNTLKVIRIQGIDIKAALERNAAYFCITENAEIDVNPAFSAPKPQHYNYDMWEGIDYIFNISKPIGERVVKLDYKGKPLDLLQEYDVVMNNYRAGGGGEYTMFKGKQVVKDIPVDMTEIIANYFLKHKVIPATVNNNWRVITD